MIAVSSVRALGLALLGLALKTSPVVAQTETSFPFRLVWRLQIEEGRDRNPNSAEIGGVADATVEWFEDILPTKDSFLDNSDSLTRVEAVVDSYDYDPNRSQPHNVRLDVTFVVKGAAPETTAMQLMADVLRADRSVFVTDYLRESGPASSVYQWTLDTATWMLQESQLVDSPSTTTTASAPSPQTSSTSSASTAHSGERQPSTTQSEQSPDTDTMASTTQGQAQAQSQSQPQQPETQTQNVPSSSGGSPTGSSLSLPFLLVWRLQVLEEEDRKPTSAEVKGVADATVEWFEATLPTKDSFLNAATGLTSVTATVLSDDWTPTKTQQHDIRLQVTFTVQGASSGTTARQLMEDIKRADRSEFVTLYLQQSGPEDSIFEWTMDTATWMLQESVLVDSSSTSATPSTQSHTGSVSTVAATPSAQSQANPLVSTSTTLAGQSQTGSSISTTPSGQNPLTNTMSSPTETLTVVNRNPVDSIVSYTAPVILKFGGISNGVDREANETELAGLLETTTEFLEGAVLEHYEDDSDGDAFVALALEWTETQYTATASLYPHLLMVDVIMFYSGEVPSQSEYYYGAILNKIFTSNSSDYLVNHVLKSNPSDSIFREVERFDWDFPF